MTWIASQAPGQLSASMGNSFGSAAPSAADRPSNVMAGTSPAPTANGIPKANPPDLTLVRPGADPVVPGVPEEIATEIRKGNFTKALEMLSPLRTTVPTDLNPPDTAAIERQIERINRYKLDFSLSREDLIRRMTDTFASFQPADLDTWISEGLIDRIRIDDTERFFGSSVANLLYLRPELKARRKTPKPADPLGAYVAMEVGRLRQAERREGQSILRPRHYRATMILSTNAPADRIGAVLRAWMPYPQETAYQKDIILRETSPEVKKIAPPDAPQRTLYFEQKIQAPEKVEFKAVYEFVSYARVNDIRMESIVPLRLGNAAEAWLREDPPHIRFTPEMKSLYKEIANGEKHPGRLARRLYDWVARNVRYSYAREYSTLDDISLYTASRRAGDCGQMALLYITLCRIGGIPARWQSAWTCYPDWKGMHDWAEIYLEPYGWVPVDPYMGAAATRYLDGLTTEQRRDVRDFYFGSMDAHRLAANSAQGAAFVPPKTSQRSDDVDNQRGELEWADGTNIYFNQFSYDMTLEELPMNSGSAPSGPADASPAPSEK